jgi:NADPH:quinone reductase-like Zn-dependent oxidoreductase
MRGAAGDAGGPPLPHSGAVLAVRFDRPGDPSVLRVAEVADPGPPPGDRLLVRTAASSVNGTDLGLRRSAPGSAVFGPFARLGFDLVGEVVRCGPAVTAFAPGDRVAALLPHSGGGQAEQVVVRQGRAALVPAEVTSVDAAGLPLAGLTALQALFGRAGLGARPGARVLVHGASGGIGSFAVQLAVLAGAHVTGTAGVAKHDFVRGLGAAEVLDSRGADPMRSPHRWDVVLDTPGVLDPARVRGALAPGGVFVTTRVASVQTARELVRDRFRRGPRFAFVATAGRSQDLARLLELVRTGRLRVPVDRVFPLADIAEAHRHAEGGATRGKIVVTVA